MKCKECKGYFRKAHDLCMLAEMGEVNGDTEACSSFERVCNKNEEYTPSATYGDYSPSHPWDALGMSIADFV